MASIENGDKFMGSHEKLAISAWILADGTRFLSDEGCGSYENEDGFEEIWDEIVGKENIDAE